MRTANDLLFLIEKRGLGKKAQLASMPLTAEYLKKAPTEVYEYFFVTREKDVEAALSAPTAKQQKETEDEEHARVKWNSLMQAMTNKDMNAAIVAEASLASDKFPANPQFVSELPQNSVEMYRVMHAKHLNPTLYGSYVRAFELCVIDGSLVLDLTKIGLQGERVTDWTLRTHKDLLKIMKPHSGSTAAVQSAQEFFDSHTELHDARKSPWGLKKIETAVNTFISRPEYRSDSSSAKLLIDAVHQSEQPVSTQLLDALFKQLVSEGKIQRDTSAVAQAGVTRMVDYR